MNEIVDRALRALEPFERQVLELVYFKRQTQRQTQRQIAEMLAVPRESVSAALADAMRKFAHLLDIEQA